MTVSVPCDLNGLAAGVTDAWKSFDIATINGNTVRLRVMENRTANWHVHEDSDELFYVVSGTVLMDTDAGAREIQAGQLFVVPMGTRHRARVEGRASMIVVDKL